jgi:hypothetical protein
MKPELMKTEPMKPGRIVAVGGGALLWCVVVYTAAVLLTSGTDGENIGKFVGTIFSGIAFGPPVWLFMKWYRTNEGTAAVARRPANVTMQHAAPTAAEQTPREPSTGSAQGPEAKLSE